MVLPHLAECWDDRHVPPCLSCFYNSLAWYADEEWSWYPLLTIDSRVGEDRDESPHFLGKLQPLHNLASDSTKHAGAPG